MTGIVGDRFAEIPSRFVYPTYKRPDHRLALLIDNRPRDARGELQLQVDGALVAIGYNDGLSHRTRSEFFVLGEEVMASGTNAIELKVARAVSDRAVGIAADHLDTANPSVGRR